MQKLLPPGFVAIQELERCVNELGLRGIQIGTHVNEWNLDEPQVFEVLLLGLLGVRSLGGHP